MKKKCATCKEIKKLSEFRKDRTRSDGLYVSCRKCQNTRNKPHLRAYQAKRRKQKPPTENQILRTKGLKRCKTCREIKSLKDFHSSGKSKKPDCKSCANSYWKARREEHLDKIVEQHFGKWECQVCGYDKCKRALDFHHLGSAEKDFSIATKYTTSFKTLEQEVKKCALLCSNCHREVHAGNINL